LNLLDSLRIDDCDSARVKVMRLQEDKVIFNQLYAPKHPEKMKQPFVVVIQDKFIRDVTKKIQRIMHGH
jgi:flagellar basal body rod protein FlgC